ncbi:MAG: hypothetical protein EP333_01035 [Bacteroidetes bacterium]|nr:MAG: hypothetical protein EP333_01035 [Bacteroidota bacterium]
MKKLSFLIRYTFISAIGMIMFPGCKADSSLIHIQKRKRLKHIPDASGIINNDKHYMIIGDNSPYLYQLDGSFEHVKKIRLVESLSESGDKLPKKSKPDLESMAVWKDSILILGSGSREETRDVLYLFDHKNEIVSQFNIHELYDHFRKAFKEKEINIEGFVIDEGYVFFLDRRSNCIIRTERKDLFDHIFRDSDLPEISLFPYKLPSIDGIKSGFSGATLSRDRNYLYFTSSVERNGSSDQKILGSFIGRIKMNNEVPGQVEFVDRFPESHGLLKIESIALVAEGQKSVNLIVVSDSDGNGSHAIKCRLKIKNESKL